MSTPVGTCHSCGGPTLPSDTACSRCGADLSAVEQTTIVDAGAGRSDVSSAASNGPSDRASGWPPPPPLEPGQRPPGSIAGRVAALLIGIVSVLSVVDLALTAALLDPAASFEQQSLLIGPAELLAMFLLIAFVSAGVAFFFWLYRTTKATPDLAAGSADHGPAASVVWWFVPIASLFMPYLIMARLYSRLELPSRRARGWLPAVWWLSFLGTHVTSLLAVNALETAATAAELGDALSLYGVSAVFTVVAGVAAIWLITEIERLKELRSRMLASSPGTAVL